MMSKKLIFLKSSPFKNENILNEKNIAQNTLMRNEVVAVFKLNNNNPLTRSEIWDLIKSKLTITEARLNDMLGRESDDPSWISQKKRRLLFKLVSINPKKYTLNPIYFEQENVSHHDDDEYDPYDYEDSEEDEDDLIDDGYEEDEKVPSFRESLLLEFWTIFRSEISKSTNLFNRRTPRPKIYYGSSTGLSKISFFCVASTRYARVEIYFNKKNPDENKELFDYFLSRKDELENNFGDKLIFERLDNRRASRIKYEVPTDVYEQNNWPKIIDFLKTNFLKLVETFQPIINEIVSDPSIVKSRIIPASAAISKKEKPITYVKNPFGCKQENGDETSTLCILGKSGTGKTTTTEEVLESMGHECLLYIPIEGEYTFSQYTGKEFEMSSLGEFVMRAQNDPSRCYTVIFDECHRPITISKLNTDLLQALSSRRNRGGERFFTMDRSTKRMYTESSEYPLSLKEKSGKILVPDNFGIVCLSSQPAVICRNEDFLNRVDIAVFTQNDRNINDLNQLIKLESGQKNIETIRGLLVSDGREQ